VRPVSNTRMPGAPGIPRAHLASPGAPAIFTGAPGVIEVHLHSTRAAVRGCTLGSGKQWKVRPVSNKRMPGAPGDLQVHLGMASPGAFGAYVISQGAPEWQILSHWWPQAQELSTRRLVPYIVRGGQWQCGIRHTTPSMTHPTRGVMPNIPVGRKLQHFKCISKASAYPGMPMCEVAAEYEPPAPPICLRGALEGCLGVYI
jgi:hypothetical protein